MTPRMANLGQRAQLPKITSSSFLQGELATWSNFCASKPSDGRGSAPKPTLELTVLSETPHAGG